jgi:hypothetical protein
MTPEGRLAAAVLAQAIEDLHNSGGTDRAAADFLTGGGNFPLFCGLMGFDPGPAVERGRVLVAKMTQGQGHR